LIAVSIARQQTGDRCRAVGRNREPLCVYDRTRGEAAQPSRWQSRLLMLTVLGGLAEFQRDLIRARTAEGRERAKARGVRLGRKPKLTAHQQREAKRRRDSGEPYGDVGFRVARML
jgi:hypothetical protein